MKGKKDFWDRHKIEIGCNACLDLIVSAKDTISKLFQLEKFGGEKEDKESTRELTIFKGRFRFGSAKELLRKEE